MKSRSISSFVLGLVAGLILGLISFYLIIIFGLVDSIGTVASGEIQRGLTAIAWVSMLGSILSIVGASLCFTKARIGGIIMFVAIACLCVLPIYSLIISTGVISISIIMLWIIPVVCVLIGAILAIKAKKKEPKPVSTVQQVPNTQHLFCKYCGAKIKGKFCSSCGSKQYE